MQPVQDWRCDHFAVLTARRPRDRRARSTLAHRSMRTPFVEIHDVLGQHSTKMAFAERVVKHHRLTDLTHRSAIELACGVLNGVRIREIPSLGSRRLKSAPWRL